MASDVIVANKLQEVINTLNRLFGRKLTWEYDYLHVGNMTSDQEILEALNKRGQEGWEVIGTIQGKLWLKTQGGIQIIVNLLDEGDSFLGYTLFDKEKNIYIDENLGEFREGPVIIDSEIRPNVKRGNPSKLEEILPKGSEVIIDNDYRRVIGKIHEYQYISRRTNSQRVRVIVEVLDPEKDILKRSHKETLSYSYDIGGIYASSTNTNSGEILASIEGIKIIEVKRVL